MELKPREKTLAIVTAIMTVLAGGWFLASFVNTTVTGLGTDRTKRESEVEKQKDRLDRIREAYLTDDRQDLLAGWINGSLDSNLEVSGLDYQNWLAVLCDQQLTGGTVVANPVRPHRGFFESLRFTVTGQTNLAKLTEFLHKFYSDPRLHQIEHLTLEPLEKSGDLKVTIAVEAVALAGETIAKIEDFQKKVLGDRKKPTEGDEAEEGAPGATSRWLANASFDLEDLKSRIVGRNVFAAYKPPPPPPPPEQPKEEEEEFNPSKYAYLTAIVTGIDGKPEIWLLERTTGKKHELRLGDEFAISEIRCKVARIGLREAEIDIRGDIWLFPIGDNFWDMIKISDADDGQ